ncbi:MAG: UDP-N-acetylmuramate dehydrogenase [Blastocatellia bacterium]
MGQKTGHELFRQSLSENVPLGPLTTLGVGGPARFFAECASGEALAAGVEWARDEGVPLFLLGGGSNVVVADRGFPGLVLRVGIRGIEIGIEGDQVTVTAGAGEEWDLLVAYCAGRNFAGFECLSGIPGRVGATPIQNVGAYGSETSETLLWVEAMEVATGTLVEIRAEECEFGYRLSRFKARDRDRFIITRVTYRLVANGRPAIRYAELQRYLSENGAGDPTPAQVREAVLAIRKRKAMVIDPGDADSRSVGSFFVNPVVTAEEFQQIKERASAGGAAGQDMPSFPSPDGRVKLSAAWLIERAGFGRGYTLGNVGTSTKHALAIVNRGGGSASEVVKLKERIQSGVLDTFGVELTPEPVFVGFGEPCTPRRAGGGRR